MAALSLTGRERRCPPGCLAPGAARRAKTLFACWNWLIECKELSLVGVCSPVHEKRKPRSGPSLAPLLANISSPLSVVGCKPEFAPSRQTVRYTGPLLFRLDKAMCCAQGDHDVRCRLTAISTSSHHSTSRAGVQRCRPGRRPIWDRGCTTPLWGAVLLTDPGPFLPAQPPPTTCEACQGQGQVTRRLGQGRKETSTGIPVPPVHNTTPASAKQKMSNCCATTVLFC